MKHYISAVFILLAMALSFHAQQASDATELTRLLNEFLAGAGRNDVAIHDRFWAEDLIYTRSAGMRINKEELMKGVRSAPAAKQDDPVTVYKAEDIRIQQYGTAAVVAFKLIGTTTKTDGTKAVSNHLNTGTFVKRNGKWQVVAWQATTVPNPETKTEGQAAPTTTNLKPARLVSATPATTKQTKSDGFRTYLKGSRGGCYYVSSSGKKTYVDHSYCK